MVIFIHGIGVHPPKEQWKREWDIALFGKPMGDETAAAYWADILHSPAATRARAKRLTGRPRGPADALDVEAIIDEAAVPQAKADQAAARIGQLAVSLTGTGLEGERSPRGARKKVIPLPVTMRSPIAKAFLQRFLTDVAAYFYQPGVRKKVQDRLRAEIEKCTEPFAIVSHSLGTVVAYEVLASAKPAREECNLLVTLGSPLGIQEVQDILKDFKDKLEVPHEVRTWHNFADRLDPVALDPTLQNDFRACRGSDHDVSIVDKLIVNERTLSFRHFNPHSAIGYLSHPDVRTVVHRQLGFDSFGRFLVARDVAAEFIDPEQRIPVLIEALEPGHNALNESPADVGKREAAQKGELDTLAGRIAFLKERIEAIAVARAAPKPASKKETEAAREAVGAVALRKYVSARLTSAEINAVAELHQNLNVYAVWRNASKRKLLERSHGPLKVDAGRASYAALGTGITWAVLDTGVRWDHPHFVTHNTILEVWDCTQNTDTPRRMYPATAAKSRALNGDRDGHGTHVCGIVAGEYTNGNRRIQGIAPRAKLIVYKVLDDNGDGEDAWIIKAADHIYRQNQSASTGLKVHGVNLSLGGPFDASVYGCGFSPICKELRDLWRQGTLVCVAAGNEGQIQVATEDGSFDLNTQLSVGDPANLEDCIAVGSVNSDKPQLYGVSWFSSRGPTADGRAKPDVVAPGERITSCRSDTPARITRTTAQSAVFRKLYRSDSGTSMACPHVSGLLAAFLSVRREYVGRPDEVKQILLGNCNDLRRDRYHQGAGMPNLMKMLTNT